MAATFRHVLSPGGSRLLFGGAYVTWGLASVDYAALLAAPAYSVEEYQAALAALLPRGRAWPRDPSSTLMKLLGGLAGSFARTNAAANDLLVQAFPATATAFLGEWESALGLPDVFGAAPTTEEGRRSAIVAALTDTGGQSIPYFVELAKTLGFLITVTQFTSYSVIAGMDRPIASDEWASTWQVNASAAIAQTYTPTVDIAHATPNFGNPVLDAVLAKFKPAHTICIVRYT